MDSHLYVDQYLRRRKGVPHPTKSVEQHQLSQAAHNAILAAAGLRRSVGDSINQQQQHQQQPQFHQQQQTFIDHQRHSSSPPPQQQHQQQQQQSTVHLTGTTLIDASSVNRTMAEHADVVKDLAEHVHAFVDKSDALNLQVQTMEDKLLNMTKMLKVAQDVGDEQAQGLAEQSDALRLRVDELTSSEEALKKELAETRAATASQIEAAVSAAVASVKADFSRELEATRSTIASMERQLLEHRAESGKTFSQAIEGHVASKLTAEQERTASAMRDLQQRHSTEMMSLERDLTRQMSERKAAMETELRAMARNIATEGAFVSGDTVRRMIDESVSAVTTRGRESAQQEVRQAVLAVQSSLRDEQQKANHRLDEVTADIGNRINACEDQNAAIETSLHEFLGAFKDHTVQQTAKMEDTAGSMKTLMELHDETRNIVASEIEGTKQWATRNMLRLKKHLDNTNVDVAAIKEAHRELHLVVERLRVAQGDHQSRLADLVSQRTKEADALAEMVDREISTVQNIARAYRQGTPGTADTVGGVNRRSRSSSHQRHAASTTEDDEEHAAATTRRNRTNNGNDEDASSAGEASSSVGDRFADRAAARRRKMQTLFHELTFRERDAHSMLDQREGGAARQ